MRKKQLICGLSILLVILMTASLVVAQGPQRGQRPQRGQAQQGQRGPGMRGGFDPAQMQQRMMERMREELGMTEAEMKAIQPLMTKVMDLRRQLQAGRFRGMMSMMGRGRGGDRGGRGGQGQNTANLTGLAKIQSELNSLVEKDSNASAIKAKMTQYRKTREKIQQDLASAQAKLIGVLTAKQEAILLMRGQID